MLDKALYLWASLEPFALRPMRSKDSMYTNLIGIRPFGYGKVRQRERTADLKLFEPVPSPGADSDLHERRSDRVDDVNHTMHNLLNSLRSTNSMISLIFVLK